MEMKGAICLTFSFALFLFKIQTSGAAFRVGERRRRTHVPPSVATTSRWDRNWDCGIPVSVPLTTKCQIAYL